MRSGGCRKVYACAGKGGKGRNVREAGLTDVSAKRNLWGERWDLNPRPPGPQPGALPTELLPPQKNSYKQDNFFWQAFFTLLRLWILSRKKTTLRQPSQGVACGHFFDRCYGRSAVPLSAPAAFHPFRASRWPGPDFRGHKHKKIFRGYIWTSWSLRAVCRLRAVLR